MRFCSKGMRLSFRATGAFIVLFFPLVDEDLLPPYALLLLVAGVLGCLVLLDGIGRQVRNDPRKECSGAVNPDKFRSRHERDYSDREESLADVTVEPLLSN